MNPDEPHEDHYFVSVEILLLELLEAVFWIILEDE